MTPNFYNGIRDLAMFDEILGEQQDNPTKRLNLMLRGGSTKRDLESFIQEGFTKQFSNWSGVKGHLNYCMKNGWLFSVDIEELINSNDSNLEIKITGFKGFFHGKSKHIDSKRPIIKRKPKVGYGQKSKKDFSSVRKEKAPYAIPKTKKDDLNKSIDRDSAFEIISHVVQFTRSRWSMWDQSWKNIDRIFIHHGYEQGGFEIFKFLPLLDKRGIYSIRALGSILDPSRDPVKYDRNYAGSLNAPFYIKLRNGKVVEPAHLLYQAIVAYQQPGTGRSGAFFWKLIWYILVACNFLTEKYESSFAFYIKSQFGKYSGNKEIRDEDILNLAPEDWLIFVDRFKPWRNLVGIGRNTFDFIFGDIVEARFANEAYKLDKANLHFFRVTGIADLIDVLDRETVISYLKSLNLPFGLREVNKGIYAYCSVTESESFGFCRSFVRCNYCHVSQICAKRIG